MSKASSTKASRLPQGPGTLLTIALLFFLSGAFRLFDGVTIANAAAGVTDKKEEATSSAPVEREVVDENGLNAAMAAVRQREKLLDERERAITDRMRALEVAEATVSQKLKELALAEERLRSTMAQSEVAAEDDLSRLTSVYENMKPKEATEVFARMAPEFAAGFLGRMRPDAAALILSGLDPDKAYSISVLLAGRNANAPVE
jgi:flagellar motility protein MotE (MotC chaperone)